MEHLLRKLSSLWIILAIALIIWMLKEPVSTLGSKWTLIRNGSSVDQWQDPASHLKVLYAKYANDLKVVRQEIGRALDSTDLKGTFGGDNGMPKAMLYDVESEINYLRIRESRPLHVLEMSPACGYSTLWLLAAIRDNSIGHLYSFDINDCAVKTLPTSWQDPKWWTFTKGDASKAFASGSWPVFDFIFIDSEHTADFARGYTRFLLDAIRNTKAIPVSVHDIYGMTCSLDSTPTPEGVVVLEWLAYSQRGSNVFTPSPAKEPALWNTISKIRKEHSIEGALSPAVKKYGECSPTLFFHLLPPLGRARRPVAGDDSYLANCKKVCSASFGLQLVCC